MKTAKEMRELALQMQERQSLKLFEDVKAKITVHATSGALYVDIHNSELPNGQMPEYMKIELNDLGYRVGSLLTIPSVYRISWE